MRNFAEKFQDNILNISEGNSKMKERILNNPFLKRCYLFQYYIQSRISAILIVYELLCNVTSGNRAYEDNALWQSLCVKRNIYQSNIIMMGLLLMLHMRNARASFIMFLVKSRTFRAFLSSRAHSRSYRFKEFFYFNKFRNWLKYYTFCPFWNLHYFSNHGFLFQRVFCFKEFRDGLKYRDFCSFWNSIHL